MSASDAPADSTETRDQEISRLQDELVIAFTNGSLPFPAFNKILTSAVILADRFEASPDSATAARAERALTRLRDAAELIEEAAV